MDTSEHILVIILSAFLALFLLLAILTIVQVLVLLHKVQRLMDKAEKAVTSAEAVAELLKKVSGPVGLFRVARTIFDMTQRKHNKEK